MKTKRSITESKTFLKSPRIWVGEAMCTKKLQYLKSCRTIVSGTYEPHKME